MSIFLKKILGSIQVSGFTLPKLGLLTVRGNDIVIEFGTLYMYVFQP